MDPANPTFSEYFDALRRRCVDELPYLPRVITAIVASYTTCTGAEFANALVGDPSNVKVWPEWNHKHCDVNLAEEIANATHLDIYLNPLCHGDVRIFTRGGILEAKFRDRPTNESLLDRLVGAPVTVEIRDLYRHAAVVCVGGYTRKAYLNSKLIRQAAHLRGIGSYETQTLWAKTECIIKCNAHITGAGLRRYTQRDGQRLVECADIFVMKRTHVIGQHLFLEPFRLGYRRKWIETTKRVSNVEWPPCVVQDCSHCERHCIGLHRATFGVDWIHGDAPYIEEYAGGFGGGYLIDY
jgi:hypothetical protein